MSGPEDGVVAAPTSDASHDASRDAEKTTPNAASAEQSINALSRMRRTSIPERRAASALPPTANSDRPHCVRVNA